MNMLILTLAVLTAGPNLPPSLDLGGSGTSVSPVASLHVWDKGGSQDWGAGIPSPTIDCAAVGTSASASLQCSGATPSFAGPGQVAAGSPWWYRNDTAVRPSIALNGSTDYWTLGDVGDTDSNVAACVKFRPDALTGLTYIFGKTNNVTGPWGIYQSGGSLRVWVVKAGGGYTEAAFGSVAIRSWYEACFSYTYVADGSSVVRTTLNGVAGTPSTVAVGPLENTTHSLAIGAITNGTLKFTGSIRRAAVWTGADAPTSAAQLAQIAATQWGLAADRPAGVYSLIARTDSTLCCPFSDAECYWVGPGAPCIHAPSYSGWAGTGGGIEVYGAGANNVAWSNDLSHWNVRGSATVAADTAPDGTNTASKITVTNNGNDVYLDTAGFTSGGAVATSLFVKRTSTSGALTIQSSRGAAYGQWTVNLATLGADYTRIWSAHPAVTVVSPFVAAGTASGVQIFGDGTARTVTVYCVSQQDGAVVKPPRATTGTAYAGLASTATTLTVPVALTDPTRWALLVSLYSAASTPAQYGQILNAGTAYAANSATLEFHTGGGLYFNVDDSAGTGSLLLAPTLWTTSGPHTVIAARDPVQRLIFDGVQQTLTGTPGTSLWSTPPSAITIGGTYPVPGLYQRLVQCNKRAGGCR